MAEYNVSSGSWEHWPLLGEGRYGHSRAMVGDTVVVAGGADHRDNYLASTLVVDTVTRQYREAGRLARERFSLGMARVGDKLVAFGGFDNSLTSLGSVEEWQEEQEVWMESQLELEYGRAEFGAVTVTGEVTGGVTIIGYKLCDVKIITLGTPTAV